MLNGTNVPPSNLGPGEETGNTNSMGSSSKGLWNKN